jgi:hypothetical protein
MRSTRFGLSTAAAVTAAITVAVIAATAAPAGAYNLTTLTGAKTGVQCSPAKFSSSSVKVVIHLGESKASSADQTAITDAITFVNSEIGNVGGSTAYVSSTTTTSDPFTFKNWFGDTTPTIHVGFDGTLADDIGGETAYGPFTPSTCTYNEAHIVLPDVVTQSWDFGYPGWDYFQATDSSAGSALWFRPIYLHELLHAFGVAHTSTEYAQMNYGVKPWANRPGNDMMKPLPDDAKALRALYPGTSSRYDVAALNTWYDGDSPPSPSGAAYAKLLCTPSLGADYDTNKFASKCGTGGAKSGSSSICAGDMLRVRYTIANYSTTMVYVTAQVYFSSDYTLGSTDYPSVSAYSLWIHPGGSKIVTASAKVPDLTALSGLTAHPILQITTWQDADDNGVIETATEKTDWNPLQGYLSVC